MTDIMELAAIVTGQDPDNIDESKIGDDLIDRFGVDLDEWEAIIMSLLPFTIPGKAALSGKEYHGFVTDGRFVVRAEIVKEPTDER